MNERISELDSWLTGLSWYEFQVKMFDGYTLTIEGGLSLLTPEIELTFTSVTFCSLKIFWNKGSNMPAISIIIGQEADKLIGLYWIASGNSIQFVALKN